MCYLLVVLPWVSVCTHLYYLKFNRKIIFINRIFTKKKKQNTNKYCDFQRFKKFPFAWKKLGGGFGKGPPLKKKASPPLPWWLITLLALLCCCPCCLCRLLCYFPSVLLTYLLAGCCTVCCVAALVCRSLTNLLIAPNNPFNTLISVYLCSIGTLFH